MPGVVVPAVRVPCEGEVAHRVGAEHRVFVRAAGRVRSLEVRQRGHVVVADDLVDEADPETSPALEALVAGAARGGQRRLEVRELARVLGGSLREEARVQDPASLRLEPRLGAVELACSGIPRLGRACEKRLLVAQVGTEQRVVARRRDRLVPAALAAQPGHVAAHGKERYAGRVDADAVALRVLWCLIEKQRTTPEAYPLSLNALRLACNQSTNRDPVVEYDEATIRAALDRLARKGWTRLASGPGSRAAKFRHLFDEALGLSRAETAVLCVLMLRGPQTPGELKQRTQRLHAFPGLADVEQTLSWLVERELVARLERRPGQKEQRFQQLLGEETAESDATFAPEIDGGDGRLDELEKSVSELRDEVAALRAELASRRGH